MKTQPKIAVTEITEDVIKEWKSKYGRVFKLEVAKEATTMDPYQVPDEIEDTNTYVGYIRYPDDKTLNFAAQKLPMFQDAGKAIITSCWLGGDEELKRNGPVGNSAAMQVLEMVKVHQGRLKEV
jgi:hypothetical protein